MKKVALLGILFVLFSCCTTSQVKSISYFESHSKEADKIANDCRINPPSDEVDKETCQNAIIFIMLNTKINF